MCTFQGWPTIMGFSLSSVFQSSALPIFLSKWVSLWYYSVPIKSLLFFITVFLSSPNHLGWCVSVSFSRGAPLVCHTCIKLHDCIAVGASLILNSQLMEALMKFILRWYISEGSYSLTSCELVHYEVAHAQTVGYSLSQEEDIEGQRERVYEWDRLLPCCTCASSLGLVCDVVY